MKTSFYVLFLASLGIYLGYLGALIAELHLVQMVLWFPSCFAIGLVVSLFVFSAFQVSKNNCINISVVLTLSMLLSLAYFLPVKMPIETIMTSMLAIFLSIKWVEKNISRLNDNAI